MKIVVVGGGFGGVKTALELANKPGVEVTLISQSSNFEYHGALYRSGTGRSPLEVVIPLRDILAHAKNVTLLIDRVTDINPAKQRVVTEMGNVVAYDAIVLAMGNVVNYFGIEGMDKNSMSLDTIANTISLRHRLTELFKGSKKQIRIAVIGGGPSGTELAGELHHFAAMVAEKYNVATKDVNVVLVEGSDRVLPFMRPKASQKAFARLQKLGVEVKLNTQVDACEPGKVCIEGPDLEADLIIWTAGSRAVGFYNEHPDVFQMERGRVKVDQYLHAVGHNNLYVIGDNAATPYSGMAQTALHDARFVARNLLRQQKSAQPIWYRTLHPVYVVPIGPNWAILQTGKTVISGYQAWLFRRRADLAIYRNFEPYKQAIKTWRKGDHLAKF